MQRGVGGVAVIYFFISIAPFLSLQLAGALVLVRRVVWKNNIVGRLFQDTYNSNGGIPENVLEGRVCVVRW